MEDTVVEDVQEQVEVDEPDNTLRELIVRAYPEVVPELLVGESLEEMLESLPGAMAAWQRVAEQTSTPAPDPTPAGGGLARAYPLDAGAMSPALKIREGLRQRG